MLSFERLTIFYHLLIFPTSRDSAKSSPEFHNHLVLLFNKSYIFFFKRMARSLIRELDNDQPRGFEYLTKRRYQKEVLQLAGPALQRKHGVEGEMG